MRMIRFTFCLLVLVFPLSVMAEAKRYLFFLHNRFTEEMPADAMHPEYGRAAYAEILQVFEKAGFTVMSEKRASNTDITLYAQKVVKQIDSLKKTGVSSDRITVVGISKGGYIAQLVSTFLADPNVNFVFIGCFRPQDLTKLPQINFCGNILTIYERSDEFGVSAIRRKETSRLKVTRFKEIELNTGLKHGFLFRPLLEWTAPVISWAHGNY